MSKTHWKKNFDYNYLGTYSLEEGQDMVLTIKKLTQEEVTGQNGQKQTCFVCYFQEVKKPMILNRTNCKTIEKLHGSPYIEDWSGKQIQIYAKSGIAAFGSTTDGLRIREFVPQKLSSEAIQKKEIKAKIRQAIAKYKGNDMKEIKAMLNAKQKNGEDSIVFLTEILKKIA